MREHPIPQDVVGYRFHIIGNMTLKQFAEVGAGCILGFLIYTTNLPGLIKWPLISIGVGLGALAAFVPFEERPLDHWIVTFAKVLYKPTKFFWKREPHIPEAFLFKPNLDDSAYTAELDLSPYRRQRIKEYLFSVQGSVQLDQFELDEEHRLQSIMSTFNTLKVLQTDVEQNATRPNLKVRVRQFKTPTSSEGVTPYFSIENKLAVSAEEHLPLAPQSQFLATKNALSVSQVAQDVNIPEMQTITVDTAMTQEEQALQAQSANLDDRAYLAADSIPAAPVIAPSQSVTTNSNLPFPAPPSEPNKLVGMILTPTQDLISDAIVEIQTSDGRVARAVKTNALGQFFVTTPLDSGLYTIFAEKDGFQFPSQQLELRGDIVPPIEIRSI